MPDDSIPLDGRLAQEVTTALLETLPRGWRLMPIGAIAMMDLGIGRSGTKDADYVPLVVVDGGFQIPDEQELKDLAIASGARVTTRADKTSVAFFLQLEPGAAKVEFIRGRNPQSGGYFVTRRLLEVCAATARQDGGLLHLSAEALAFLKAWAAVDQDKLVEAGKDRAGFHAARAAAFRQDVAALARVYLDAGKQPFGPAIPRLLSACPRERESRVRDVLERYGWRTDP